MTSIILLAVLVAAIGGLVTKLWLDWKRSDFDITWPEFALGLAIISVALTPVVVWAGYKLAQSNNLVFNEYHNGWETQAQAVPTVCERDGACWYEYDCDPYTVMVSYSCNCDSKGNCSTCWRTETRYHSCPYVTVETDYYVHTTLGPYTIAESRFPDNPDSHRWRASEPVPNHIAQRAGIGPPEFWSAVERRIREGRPGPVTKRASYKNYLLASDATILTQYSGEIEKLKALNLLPALSASVFNHYMAHKAYSAGSVAMNPQAWSSSVAYFNAAFGSELRGDLHIILVDDRLLARSGSNPDAYIIAIKAYWQNPTHFKSDALSKNAVIVAIGTEDSKTVKWARAATGMPLGNEAFIAAIRSNLRDTPLTPEAVLGKVRGYFDSGGIRSHAEVSGVLRSMLWTPPTRFQRVSMEAKDFGDVGQGFSYLAREVRISTGQRIFIAIMALLSSAGVWIFMAANGNRAKHKDTFSAQHYADFWTTEWNRTRLWIWGTARTLWNNAPTIRK